MSRQEDVEAVKKSFEAIRGILLSLSKDDSLAAEAAKAALNVLQTAQMWAAKALDEAETDG